MPGRRPKAKPAKPPAAAPAPTGLVKVTAYLHPDEAAAIEELARKQRCSKADAVRRAIRGYFGIED